MCTARSVTIMCTKTRWTSGGVDQQGMSYYHNIKTGQNTYNKPDGFVECAAPLPEALGDHRRHDRTDISAHDTTLYNPHGTFRKHRSGHFVVQPTKDCINNQNCGLVDLGACHGCDTEQECKDMGVSSTLFVTHERKYMHMKRWNGSTGRYEQAHYHCRREVAGRHTCSCKCDAHRRAPCARAMCCASDTPRTVPRRLAAPWRGCGR